MGDNPFEEPSSHNQRLLNSGAGAQRGSSYGGSGGYQPKEVFGDSYVEAEGAHETFKPELQFQTFQHTNNQQQSSSANNKIGGGGGGAVIHPDQSTVVDFEEDNRPLAGGSGSGGNDGGAPPPPPSSDGPPPDPQITGSAKFWTIEFYRPYFNVDTNEVLQRIFRSLTPFRFGFIETAKTNPDFYGPFWIATTLIFVLAMAGNLHQVITDTFSNHHKPTPTQAPNSTAPINGTQFMTDLLGASSGKNDDSSSDFYVIVVGAAVIYGYTIVIPLILWGVFKYLSVPVRLLEMVCIYGYTLFIFIPVSIICIVLPSIAQWIVVLVTCAWSGFFLVSNLLVTVKDIALKRGLVAMVVVGALHMGLGLTYKLYFFGLAYKTD